MYHFIYHSSNYKEIFKMVRLVFMIAWILFMCVLLLVAQITFPEKMYPSFFIFFFFYIKRIFVFFFFFFHFSAHKEDVLKKPPTRSTLDTK